MNCIPISLYVLMMAELAVVLDQWEIKCRTDVAVIHIPIVEGFPQCMEESFNTGKVAPMQWEVSNASTCPNYLLVVCHARTSPSWAFKLVQGVGVGMLANCFYYNTKCMCTCELNAW